MYRNFSTGSLICFLTYFIYSIVFVFNLVVYKVKITNDYSFIVTDIVFLIFTLILFRRTRRFGETYVKYVFRGFAEHYRSAQINQNIKISLWGGIPMKIHFLNVGHGDTTLVDFDGVYMLIDCNISSTNDAAYKYIDKTIPKPQDKNAKKSWIISSLPTQTKTI